MNLKHIDLYNYLMQVSPNELVKETNHRYHLKSHDSLVLNHGYWYWFSHSFGGYSAYYYLIKVENLTEEKAITALKQIDPSKMIHHPRESINHIFTLPSHHYDQSLVFEYLCKKRKISPTIVKQLMNEDRIYADERKNIIFVNYDESKLPRFACYRSTISTSRKDIKGSQKKYSFSLPGSSKTLHIFESIIDLLSYKTIEEYTHIKSNDHYLSLSGLSHIPLEYYLSMHSIDTLIFHLDNDLAGKNALMNFKVKYSSYQIEDHSLNNYKDINEALVDITRQIEKVL